MNMKGTRFSQKFQAERYFILGLILQQLLKLMKTSNVFRYIVQNEIYHFLKCGC